MRPLLFTPREVLLLVALGVVMGLMLAHLLGLGRAVLAGHPAEDEARQLREELRECRQSHRGALLEVDRLTERERRLLSRSRGFDECPEVRDVMTQCLGAHPAWHPTITPTPRLSPRGPERRREVPSAASGTASAEALQ